MLKARNKGFFVTLFLLVLGASLSGQSDESRVQFASSDSILITADLHMADSSFPMMVLFHDLGSSRGEFSSILNRFQKMNFNCLVPDLRNGGNASFVANQTLKEVREKGASKSTESIMNDIRSCISYVSHRSDSSVVLIGAGANGSLAMLAAKEFESVTGVIALSPGEYFLPALSIQESLDSLNTPVLITATKMEMPYMERLTEKMPPDAVTLFSPESHSGERATKALLPVNESNGEYWLSILLFVKDL